MARVTRPFLLFVHKLLEVQHGPSGRAAVAARPRATVAPSNQWRTLPCPQSSADDGNSLLHIGCTKRTSYTRFTDKRYCLFGTSRVQTSARRPHILTGIFCGMPQPLSPTARQCIPAHCTDTLPFNKITLPLVTCRYRSLVRRVRKTAKSDY